MTPTPRQFLTAFGYLHQAATDAVVEFHVNEDEPPSRRCTVYSNACMRNLTRAAEALGFKLVPAIPQPVPAMDTPTQEAAHEVIAFPSPKSKPGAPSELGVGQHEEE